VITDTHANLPALEAALAEIERLDVAAVYCGGALVGYGPHPNEVCALVQERGIPTIYGSHDYAIGRASAADPDPRPGDRRDRSETGCRCGLDRAAVRDRRPSR
jgi:hypothetical protein